MNITVFRAYYGVTEINREVRVELKQSHHHRAISSLETVFARTYPCTHGGLEVSRSDLKQKRVDP